VGGGFSTSIAGSSSGSFLIVSVANDGGLGTLQRRNPVNGTAVTGSNGIGVVVANGAGHG
jgi:hypothetical protein